MATGILAEGDIAPPIRDILRHQRNAGVLLGDVNDIDLQRRLLSGSGAGTTRLDSCLNSAHSLRVMNPVPHRRRSMADAVLLASLMLAWSPSAFALDPALDASQYAHTSWKIREGFTKGVIGSIVQTPDGYLWLATEFALVRFDGVRTVEWQSLPYEQLPSNEIDDLLAARDALFG